MDKIPKTGERFVYDGLILEVQESGPSCLDCFFFYEEEHTCTRSERVSYLPHCIDPHNKKFMIYKYVREATDEEIRRGALT